MSSQAVTKEDAVPTLPRHVLIVEDDPVQVKAYAAFGKRYGFSVTTTGRTTDVMRMVLQHRPDAVVLDFELEDGQSLKVLRCLRASPETAEIPVAVISGYLSDDTRHQIRKIGEVPTLEKPWTIDQLLGTLLRLAGTRRSP